MNVHDLLIINCITGTIEMEISFDGFKAKKELSWKPNLTLNETIEFTVDWYKSFFTGNDVEDLSNQQINYYSHK